MLGNEKRGKLYFLNVKEGCITCREGSKVSTFDYVEGFLEKVLTKEREFNGEKMLYWYVNLRDEKGDLYSMGLPYSSGVFKSIILSIASCKDLNPLTRVKIHTYMKDNRSKVQVFGNGEKLNWITTDLPPIREQMISGKVVKDDTLRMEYISRLVESINSKIAG